MANSYFQIIHKSKKTYLKVYPATDNGEKVEVEEVMSYLSMIHLDDYDMVTLNDYIKNENFEVEYLLCAAEVLPENEHVGIEVKEEGMYAIARFYPPSSEGNRVSKNEILGDLRIALITHGIQEQVIDDFIANPQYCTDYRIAEATLPVQGNDASIEYHFDINVTAKPKLNEDGSVDFHQLGNIKPIQEGDLLATLTPARKGKEGLSVTGAKLLPNKVKPKNLRFGRNITLSEDRCQIFSEVSGHVSLIDDLVMVSNIYEVPANVDASTGDIEYNGTVVVAGNVMTGYKIEATGDIVVNGVVEGATLIAGGNIVLKRGMQGMSRGTLEAEGNITAKFIENGTMKCKGDVQCDAILHSQVDCEGKISVLGRKGLINGGHVRTYGTIEATQLGSTMGTTTVVEVMSDVELIKQLNEINEKIEENRSAINKMNDGLMMIRNTIVEQNTIGQAQIAVLSQIQESKPALLEEIKELKYKKEAIEHILEYSGKSCIKVEKMVNSGVHVFIRDVSKIISENLSRCQFVRDGADIRSKGMS